LRVLDEGKDFEEQDDTDDDGREHQYTYYRNPDIEDFKLSDKLFE
jgi:hypothetical protein